MCTCTCGLPAITAFFTNIHVQILLSYSPSCNLVVSELLGKHLLANKLFVGKEMKGVWEKFVNIFVHQCPQSLEISLETAEVFEEHGMMEEAKCVRGEMFTV